MPRTKAASTSIPNRYGVYALISGRVRQEYQLVMVTLNLARAMARADESLDAFVVDAGPTRSFRHTLSDMDARNAVKVER